MWLTPHQRDSQPEGERDYNPPVHSARFDDRMHKAKKLDFSENRFLA